MDELMYISAKTGMGVDKVFEAIIDRIPPPKAADSNELKLFLFGARLV